MSDTRVLIVSGKGGVGKTTIAAATAVAAADRGHRTLVMSLDRAHNLGDVLQTKVGPTPINLPDHPNLHAMEVDAQVELSRNWDVLQNYLTRLFSYLGVDGATAEELAVFPGLEELLVLTRLADLASTGEYDLIVADMAPTASSLRYLSFPDMMEGVFGKLLTWDQRFAVLLRPLQGKHLKMPVPENEVYHSLRNLAERLGSLRRILADTDKTAVRLVMIPESIVLEETQRALTYLSLFGLGVDSIVINRMLPDEALQGYFQKWGKIQSRVVDSAREGFYELPIHQLQFQPSEVLGTSQLLTIAKELYGDSDPADFHTAQRPLIYEPEGEDIVLSVSLPNADPHSLDLRRRDRDLILTVDGWRRRITLPDILTEKNVSRARFAGGRLRIHFTNDGQSI